MQKVYIISHTLEKRRQVPWSVYWAYMYVNLEWSLRHEVAGQALIVVSGLLLLITLAILCQQISHCQTLKQLTSISTYFTLVTLAVNDAVVQA